MRYYFDDINTWKNDVIEAVSKLSKTDYIEKYVNLMEEFQKSKAPSSKSFRKDFIAYYRFRGVSDEWLDLYFSLFSLCKKNNIFYFNYVLDSIHSFSYEGHFDRRVHPVFASKMIATVYPNMPIYDSHVISVLNLKTVDADNDEYRIVQAKQNYNEIVRCYAMIYGLEIEKIGISAFDAVFPDYKDLVSNVKKIDFILWAVFEK